jgi:proteasome lid subunit RPN8/RPN11
MSLFKHKNHTPPPQRIWKITHSCLNLILESAKSTYPNEFGALLRADSRKKDTIVELVLLPGTVSGDAHAIFRLQMLPIDYSIVGTVHSHPSPYPIPSGADYALFEKFGKIHIIAAYPYSEISWKAYDYKGNPQSITLI